MDLKPEDDEEENQSENWSDLDEDDLVEVI